MRLFACLLAVLLTLLASRATAQSDTSRRWTLDDCISYALEHNIQIKT